MAIGDIGFLQQNPIAKLAGGFNTGFDTVQNVLDTRRQGEARQLFGQSVEAGQLNPLLAAASPELAQQFQTQQRASGLADIQGAQEARAAETFDINKASAADKAKIERVARDSRRILNITDPEARNAALDERIATVEDPRDTIAIRNMPFDQQTEALQDAFDSALPLTSLADQEKPLAKTAAERAFNSLTEGLTEEEKSLAKRIELGLSPRATGSAAQTIAQQGTAEDIGKSQAVIKQREKFGELTGASRAKAIDKGFDKIQNINSSISNLDRAIREVEGGAGTGAVERFLPSFKAASVALDQIQNELALDVIGGVTLGAISEAELDLVKQVALPQGLDGPELIAHLRERKAAQEKVRAYFNEQIQHLDQGGTIASFLRQKERSSGAGQAGGAGTAQTTGKLVFNPATGQIEEAP